jgi:hypothetical protein
MAQQNSNDQAIVLKMSFHASLSVIERVGEVGNKNASRQLSTCEGQNPIDL